MLACEVSTVPGQVQRAGESITWLSAQLGHAKLSTAMNDYGHFLAADGTDLSLAELEQVQDRPKLVPVG